MLTLIFKVIEKVIYGQASTFLNSRNFLYTYQSGFRKKKNYADLCLPYLNDKILEGFEKSMMTGMILIDLKKVFDTIDDDLLLPKLYANGFSKGTVNWFKCYLSNSSFLVNLGNNCFQPASVSSRVPQGSFLGPLSFLIYVNDMSQAIKCDLSLYADNSCLVCQHKDINEIQKPLTDDFSNICNWFVDNKLSIHFGEDETKSILFLLNLKGKIFKNVT